MRAILRVDFIWKKEKDIKDEKGTSVDGKEEEMNYNICLFLSKSLSSIKKKKEKNSNVKKYVN